MEVPRPSNDTRPARHGAAGRARLGDPCHDGLGRRGKTSGWSPHCHWMAARSSGDPCPIQGGLLVGSRGPPREVRADDPRVEPLDLGDEPGQLEDAGPFAFTPAELDGLVGGQPKC